MLPQDRSLHVLFDTMTDHWGEDPPDGDDDDDDGDCAAARCDAAVDDYLEPGCEDAVVAEAADEPTSSGELATHEEASHGVLEDGLDGEVLAEGELSSSEGLATHEAPHGYLLGAGEPSSSGGLATHEEGSGKDVDAELAAVHQQLQRLRSLSIFYQICDLCTLLLCLLVAQILPKS